MTHNLTRHQVPPTDLYDQDYAHWLEQTALCLRKQAFEQLDIDNLIEEIEDMGRSEKRAIESNLRVVLWHLLKWRYQPQNRSSSWQGSIAEHRIRIRKALGDSPSLNNYLNEVFAETYQDAIKVASEETGLDPKTFPTTCEWTLSQALDETWRPD